MRMEVQSIFVLQINKKWTQNALTCFPRYGCMSPNTPSGRIWAFLLPRGAGWRGVGGGGGRGAGGGGGKLPIYDIVRMCVPNGPLFQRCQV